MRKAMVTFLLTAILFACSNPKEKMVERQKQINDELPVIKTQMQQASLNVDFHKVDSLAERQVTLQKEYDSLQMELKKY